MLGILNDINKIRYERLIEYAYSRCDMFTLRVPVDILEEDNQFRQGIKQKLKIIEPYLIKKYTDNIYFGSIGGDCEIYIISLDKELKSFLLEAGGLYNWEYPKFMPEDLCFITKGVCWLESVAHEDLCRIFPQNNIEKDILEKVIGLRLYEIDDWEPYTIEL